MRSLRVAAVLGVMLCIGCGTWKRFLYEGFGRDAWQEPARVVESLELEEGDRVADLGAGGGYFTFRLADAVGEGGRLYAVDVDPAMIEHLEARSAEEGADNVEVILGEFTDPLLPDGGIDLLFTCNTYHHIEDPVSYFADVRTDLAEGGRVAVIELNGVSWFPRLIGHYTPKDRLVEEMRRAGYRVEREFDFPERQSFVIFSPSP